MKKIMTDFAPRHADLWSRHTLRLSHSLHERDLFSDESLANLIETIRPERMAINTMSATGHDNRNWKYCDRAGLPGSRVLEAVERGRVWINMNAIQEVDPRFSELLEQMYEELNAHMPGFQSFKHKLGLLISSPNAQVYYHADVPGQGLWQIRGRKRIWIYPNEEPFLRTEEIERIVRGVQEEEMAYEPWFEEHAVAYDLEPGQMLHWALNGPHRVQNYDCVNVSLTTEHWTRDIRRTYAMNYGNGLLRSMGWTPRSRGTSGLSFWPKAALAMAYSKSGLQQKRGFKRSFAYRLDPSAPNGVVPVDAQAGAEPLRKAA